MKKIILPLIISICGILGGVFIIIASIMDINIPKPVWLLMAICWFASAAYNFYNYRSYRDKNKE